MPLPVYEVPAIRVNTTKSTYTFTSVIYSVHVDRDSSLIMVIQFNNKMTVLMHFKVELANEACT